MKLRCAPRSSRWSSLLLVVSVTLGASALLSGCCTTYDEDVCALYDDGGSCPSREVFSGFMGGDDVTDGPQERSFVDMRFVSGDPATPAQGYLCCYRVKRESCQRVGGSVY